MGYARGLSVCKTGMQHFKKSKEDPQTLFKFMEPEIMPDESREGVPVVQKGKRVTCKK